MKLQHTFRGFAYVEFTDSNDKKCSIQKSSRAFDDFVWLGVDNASPQIMAKDAIALGIKTDTINGWIDYPLPKEAHCLTRMHNNQRAGQRDSRNPFSICGNWRSVSLRDQEHQLIKCELITQVKN